MRSRTSTVWIWVMGTLVLLAAHRAAALPHVGRYHALAHVGVFTVIDGLELSVWRSAGNEAGVVELAQLTTELPITRPLAQSVVMAGRVYVLFHQDTPAPGHLVLWQSDGTPEGTAKVLDLPGHQLAFGVPQAGELVAMGNLIAFPLSTAAAGRELWVSDGTEAGTHIVADINPGTASSMPSKLVVLGDKIYFGARTPMYGDEIWRSDGTEEGTELVVDINSMRSSFDIFLGPVPLARSRGGAVVLGRSADGTGQFWSSDPAQASATKLAEVSLPFGTAQAIFSTGDFAYFRVPGAPDVTYRTDGTMDGTIAAAAPLPDAVFDGEKLFAFPIGSSPTAALVASNPDNTPVSQVTLTRQSGELFFPPPLYATQGEGVYFLRGPIRTLWHSDGTETGTVQVAEPSAPITSIAGFEGKNMFFEQTDEAQYTIELWTTDGTSPGTKRLGTIFDINSTCPGDCNRDTSVTVDELVSGVAIALDAKSVTTCEPMDRDRNHSVTIDEILAGVVRAQTGCG